MAEEKKIVIYQKIVTVLEPEIQKLKDFMYFHQKAVKLFNTFVTKLTAPSEDPPSGEKKQLGGRFYFANIISTFVCVFVEALEWRMIQVLDLFALLDDLKNMKACLNNDFSFYKRATQFLRQRNKTSADDNTQENHSLYDFSRRNSSLRIIIIDKCIYSFENTDSTTNHRYLFLANQSSITASLRDELNAIKKADSVLISVITNQSRTNARRERI